MLIVLINYISKCFIVCSLCLILNVFMCETHLRTVFRWGTGGGSEHLRANLTPPTKWRQTIDALRICAVRICLLIHGLMARNLILDPCFYFLMIICFVVKLLSTIYYTYFVLQRSALGVILGVFVRRNTRCIR